MIIPGADRSVRPQVTQAQTKLSWTEETASDVFAPNPTGTLETLTSRSKISGFHAGSKLSKNMRSGVVAIESPAFGENGRLELSQVLWIPKAVLVVDGQRQELPISKLPRQGFWDHGGFQAELPGGKQLEIRSCLIHSELFARRYGVQMEVSEPTANAAVTLAFQDPGLASELNGQTAGAVGATAHQGQNSVSYSSGNSTLHIKSENLSASAYGCLEEIRTDYDKGGHSFSLRDTDKFPLDKVTAVKSEVTNAIDGAFQRELTRDGLAQSMQPLFQSSAGSPILMSIYADR